MANITPTRTEDSDRRNVLYLWETLTSSNSAGTSIRLIGNLSDIIMQATGTFNSATLVMQGSMDNSTWVTLKDPADASVSLTAAGGFAIRDKWRWIRPSTSGGGGSQDIDCYLQITRVE